MQVKDFNISEFIRYVLTGFNFLFFVFALPIAWLNPEGVKGLLGDSSALIGILLSISMGYLMDTLKMYQFTPVYKRNRDLFRERIAELLEIALAEAPSYISLITKIWDENSPYNLERRRAEWILALNTASIFLLSILSWLFFGLLHYLENGFTSSMLVPIAATTLLALAARRLFKIAEREREKGNQEFYTIIQQNKEVILKSWVIRPDVTGHKDPKSVQKSS